MPRAKAQAAGGSFPDSPHSHRSSRVTRQRAFFIQARTLPHTAAASSHLHRLSVDFAHHPTLLLFEEAEVGERLLSHSSLGSWSTPSLSKLAVSDQDGAVLQGSASTCRAYPTTVEFAHQAQDEIKPKKGALKSAVRAVAPKHRVRAVSPRGIVVGPLHPFQHHARAPIFTAAVSGSVRRARAIFGLR